IDNPEITINQLMKHIKGPDFPTGCTVCGLEVIKEYFTTGRGSIKVRGKVGIEQLKGGKEQIVITEIPYNVNRALLCERIAELVEGYLIALANLDEFIHIIRKSKTRDEAKVKLLAFEWTQKQVERWGILLRSEARLTKGRYALSERQVDAILELRLYQLTGLE